MFVVLIGPFEGEYGLPDVVGPFSTHAEASDWREEVIGKMDWDRHREQIDVVELTPRDNYASS